MVGAEICGLREDGDEDRDGGNGKSDRDEDVRRRRRIEWLLRPAVLAGVAPTNVDEPDREYP